MVKINKTRFKKAITGSGGNRELICQNLDCAYSTLKKFLARHPDMRELLEEEKNKVNDLAENKLIKRLERDDWKAIKYRLDRMHPEYRPKQEITATETYDVRISQEEIEEHLKKVLKNKKKDGETNNN